MGWVSGLRVWGGWVCVGVFVVMDEWGCGDVSVMLCYCWILSV
mgnify:CR=1 FL=1